MSIRLMSMVWELQLSHAEQSVALAMADHADDDGSKIFPSIARIAWKTGYSERQVQRIIVNLVDKRLLIVVFPPSQHRATEYRMDIDAIPPKPPFVSQKRSARGDILAPRGDISKPRGDIAMSPDPSLEPPIDPPILSAADEMENPIDLEEESEREDPTYVTMEDLEDPTWISAQRKRKSLAPDPIRDALAREAMAACAGRKAFDNETQRKAWRRVERLYPIMWIVYRIKNACDHGWKFDHLIACIDMPDKFREWVQWQRDAGKVDIVAEGQIQKTLEILGRRGR